MAPTTAAQEEFNNLVLKSATPTNTRHPEDRTSPDRDNEEETTEEDHYRSAQINSIMRSSVNNDQLALKLPPASFDSGRSTGVKGVIADARHYEIARKSKWKNRAQAMRRSIFNLEGFSAQQAKQESPSDSNSESGEDDDEETFLSRWRESRRKELEIEGNKEVRNRRTSPSVRLYGRLDEVDALGYLDAIEKVRRDTTVAVFVYDNECEVSAAVESAMLPLVKKHPAVHFVKVHYDEIEFDAAAVPSILAYRNQGDLVANLTGLIEMMPEDDDGFGTSALEGILRTHSVL